MSAERDELLRLVREIPEDQVPQVLADVRSYLRVVREEAWPPPGTSDASVIAVAERLGITEIATLDHRHFTVVRPGTLQT